MLSAALQADTAPLATHYGAVVAIGELGHEVRVVVGILATAANLPRNIWLPPNFNI